MADKFWAEEWPNLNSISIVLSLDAHLLPPLEAGALYRLVWFAASRAVNSAYSDAGSVLGFPDDEGKILRITGCSKAEWGIARDAVLDFFELKSGVWHLRDESQVRLSKPGRFPIPVSTQVSVITRDNGRCVYCGDTDGPFHLDHIWPVSRGGSNEESNLVTACASCNLSKGSKTLLEWMEAKR